MDKVLPYNATAAIAYAKRWSLLRNPMYLDFTQLGGDCTNFISQCLYAGSHIMNYTPITGWYYRNANDRSASWTGVNFLHKFLTTNKGSGPFGRDVTLNEIVPGDVIQFGNDINGYHHSLLVLETTPDPTYDQILIATHSYDAINRPLSSYEFTKIRFIHIEGVRA
ncbi:amidase domain-containing protein [Cellulosilyticum lentocellum]|uniref:Putative amidase domain-containing protein n=1 Tax=Cellulosilyticum lentocellum (strain ATCC 49066 / DSM 5427 / NCIMB 11756 / RHM5) TaxID=642492 RepID=F2JIA0_CELLD|nr:amidase domain-containing protein [Cellulosilyticum lentocellum]ADZ83128.1 hypothetical protein Clole_1402 [Cellulosilyticum lentocellum DSM 5427]